MLQSSCKIYLCEALNAQFRWNWFLEVVIYWLEILRAVFLLSFSNNSREVPKVPISKFWYCSTFVFQRGRLCIFLKSCHRFRDSIDRSSISSVLIRLAPAITASAIWPISRFHRFVILMNVYYLFMTISEKKTQLLYYQNTNGKYVISPKMTNDKIYKIWTRNFKMDKIEVNISSGVLTFVFLWYQQRGNA